MKKVLARFKLTGLEFSARPNGLKKKTIQCKRNLSFCAGEKWTRACAVVDFSVKQDGRRRGLDSKGFGEITQCLG